MPNSSAIFQEKSAPITSRRPRFLARSGIAPSSVPDGQISLQNQGVPYPAAFLKSSGKAMTNTDSTTYFSLRRALSNGTVFIFGVGMRCNSSQMSPNGHSHPHTKRPSKEPKAIRHPSTKKGNGCPLADSIVCSAPIGQEEIAPGQE